MFYTLLQTIASLSILLPIIKATAVSIVPTQTQSHLQSTSYLPTELPNSRHYLSDVKQKAEKVATLTSSTTSTSIGIYENLSTSLLPVIYFYPGNSLFFDYFIQVGENKQPAALRLDLVQGNVWLPATNSFVECSSTSSGVELPIVTLPSIGTAVQTVISTVVSTVSSDEVTTTSTEKSTRITMAVLDATYQQSCASLGVYDILESIYAAFLDIYAFTETTIDNATYYFKLFASGILLEGIWAIDNFIFPYRSNHSSALEFLNVPFVYSNFSNVGVGSLAVGISQNDYGYDYNFISNFVANGLISSNSYSVATGADNGTAPRLILGGIDQNLIYTDEATCYMAIFDFLPTLDESGLIVTDNDGVTDTIMSLPIFRWGVTSNTTGQSIAFAEFYDDRMQKGNYPKPALLDSRHLYNYIPYSTLIELAVELNAYYSSSLDIWIADCSIGDTGSIDLFLGNYTIHMPISNFLTPATYNNTNLVFASGDSACFLRFLPDYRLGHSLLGSSFLRNIYLAVDNENKQFAVSPLQDQLADVDLYISYSTQTYIYDSATTTYEITSTGATETPERGDISVGLSSVSGISLNRTMTTSSLISRGKTPTALTFETTVGPDNSRRTTGTKDPQYYAIESGILPFAHRFVNITSLTLTIPQSIVLTDTIVQSTVVYISDGEVFVQTNNFAGTSATGSHTRASTQRSTIYGYTSYVTPISSVSASSNDANNLRIPINLLTSNNNISIGKQLIGCIIAITIGVLIFL